MRINERTLKMKQAYVVLHRQGMTPGKIAKKFGLSVQTVYNHLGEIAKANGMNRADLLTRPHDKRVCHGSQPKEIKPIDASNLVNSIDKAIMEAEELLSVTGKNKKEKNHTTHEKGENIWTKKSLAV